MFIMHASRGTFWLALSSGSCLWHLLTFLHMHVLNF